MLTRRNAVLGLVAASMPHSRAFAASYPERPVHIIVAYPAGGAIDMTARLLGEKLSKTIGQSVVVENRAGANGLIGLEAVFRANPDGYTLALTGASNVSAGPHLRPASFEALSMRHITRLVKAPLTLAVKKDLPVNNVAEFIELARSRELTYASAGIGSSHHLTGELFRLRTDTKLLHVPYRGTGPAVQDLVAGVVDAAFGDPTLVANWRSGQVKALGASSDGRWSLNPDLPAIGETVTGFVSENWYGIAAPPNTPETVVSFLHQHVQDAMKDAFTVQKFNNTGLEPATMATADFAAYVRRDSELWAGVIQKANIQLPK